MSTYPLKCVHNPGWETPVYITVSYGTSQVGCPSIWKQTQWCVEKGSYEVWKKYRSTRKTKLWKANHSSAYCSWRVHQIRPHSRCRGRTPRRGECSVWWWRTGTGWVRMWPQLQREVSKCFSMARNQQSESDESEKHSRQSFSSSPSPQLSWPLQRKIPGMQRLGWEHLNWLGRQTWISAVEIHKRPIVKFRRNNGRLQNKHPMSECERYRSWPRRNCPDSRCLHRICMQGWYRCPCHTGTGQVCTWTRLSRKQKRISALELVDFSAARSQHVWKCTLTTVRRLIWAIATIVLRVTFPPERNALIILADKLRDKKWRCIKGTLLRR